MSIDDVQFRAPDETRSDEDIFQDAVEKITQWQAAGTPCLTEVQTLFYDSIFDGASAMVRNKIVEAIFDAFGNELGGKRAMLTTWNKIAKDCATERAQEARNNIAKPEMTPEEKVKARDALWPTVRELAQVPDLMERIIDQVQSMGVVNERKLITLTYIAATSRVLPHPINVIAKGTSSGGKSFTIKTVLDLIGANYVNQLTSSSALSLVYDAQPLVHKVIFLFEANQLQAEKQTDRDS